MVTVNVYSVIDKEEIFMSMFGFEDAVFSADTVHRVFDEHPKEKEFLFNINCDGGLVSEGMRIYDVLRTSGKTIHTNIEGGCHSMAIVLLLAAPPENRSANPNARALIHEVRTFTWEDMTAEELRDLADMIDGEQSAILDIYAERTATDRETLETLMKEEKQRTATELLNYGFISKINSYNTNKKRTVNMSKKPAKTSLQNRIANCLTRAANLLAEAVNFDFTDEEGNILFSTENEDDTLEVGMAASPDGTFELPDGRTVTVADGAITDISEAPDEETENLRTENAALKESLEEAVGLVNELKGQIGSSYTAKPRNKAIPGSKTNSGMTSAERKAAILENLKKMRGGK